MEAPCEGERRDSEPRGNAMAFPLHGFSYGSLSGAVRSRKGVRRISSAANESNLPSARFRIETYHSAASDRVLFAAECEAVLGEKISRGGDKTI